MPSTVEPSDYRSDEMNTTLTAVLDSDKIPEFVSFKLKYGITKYTFYLCIFQTVLCLFRFFRVIDDGVPLIYQVAVCARIIIPIVGWMYIYFSRKYVHSDVLSVEGKRIILLGNLVIFLQAFFAGIMLIIWKLAQDDCRNVACFEDHPHGLIPATMLFYSINGSIAVPIFYKCHNAYVPLFSVIMTYVLMFIGGLLVHVSIFDLIGILFMGGVACTCSIEQTERKMNE
jgi:hypothetical protein